MRVALLTPLAMLLPWWFLIAVGIVSGLMLVAIARVEVR